jgi:glycosyltransferase involved in cell wall biosynthesis
MQHGIFNESQSIYKPLALHLLLLELFRINQKKAYHDMSRKEIIHIIINSATRADSLSGADRIFIEFARRWVQMGYHVIFYTNEEGRELFRRQKLDEVTFVIWKLNFFQVRKVGLLLSYLYGFLSGVWYALTKLPGPISDERTSLVFSSSDFWPDSIPGFFMSQKLKAPWVASFFLFAPNPFRGFDLAGKIRFPQLKDLMYYLTQLPIYHLIKKKSDCVFITSQPDVEKFLCSRLSTRQILVIRGGVDLQLSKSVPSPAQKKYDAVFIGRFHAQKGTLVLIEVWEKVCKVIPDARLVMIGNGPLEGKIREKITSKGLEKNIELVGFMDGEEKIRVFKSSKIVVHPATYDSGGMAAAEAMACGLPAIGFDLPALKTYYAKGMLKAPIGDIDAFAELIIKLLEDPKLYEATRAEAVEWTQAWDWDERAKSILNQVKTSIL